VPRVNTPSFLGDLPTWLGSIGTIAALSVGVVALWRDSTDRRRAQAAKVSVRFEAPDEATVHNDSDAPIYAVMAWFDNAVGIPYSPAATSEDTLPAGDSMRVRAVDLPMPNEGMSASA
jgi:hypothetical protein